MSNEPTPVELTSRGLGYGCLAGFGLAILFFVISGVAYVLLGAAGLASNIRLLVALLSGPILGTVIAVAGWLAYSERLKKKSGD